MEIGRLTRDRLQAAKDEVKLGQAFFGGGMLVGYCTLGGKIFKAQSIPYSQFAHTISTYRIDALCRLASTWPGCGISTNS